jgi:Spy/CpxP family protein refolding chaperone
MRPPLLAIALILAATTSGLAQHAERQGDAASSPYAGLQHRTVKTLSPQQIDDLRAGRGMGLALAAELNGYPGPMHVLELADRLALSAEQRHQVQQLYDAMKRETIPIGEKLIAEETELDEKFAARTIEAASLTTLTNAIGRTQAGLRAAHLKYHLHMMEVLTPSQIQRYAELRGYAGARPPEQHPRQHPR